MANRWGKMETVRDFIFLGSQITADGDYSHEFKSSLLLGRKTMTNLLLLLSRFSRVRLCATPQTAATRLPHPWDSPGKNTGVGCHFLLQCMKVKSQTEVAQSCLTLTLSDPMDCSLPGSSVHGIFQARVLEWGAIAFSDDKPREHIKKQRHHFSDKGLDSQSYGFPLVMYRCEIWTIKKSECWRIDAFELWCWRRLLRVPWVARRSNHQS